MNTTDNELSVIQRHKNDQICFKIDESKKSVTRIYLSRRGRGP